MVLTSGDGLIYNIARAKMLGAAFRWTDVDKYAAIADTDYVFDELHKTLADVGAQANLGISSAKLGGPFVSANTWAGSDLAQFVNEVWTKPIGAFILVKFVGTSVQAADYSKYELIACLTTFLGGPIYPDGSPFSLTYDQSNGQQGWFRP